MTRSAFTPVPSGQPGPDDAVRPAAAFAKVQLGLALGGVETALDLEEGLARLAAPSSEAADADA